MKKELLFLSVVTLIVVESVNCVTGKSEQPCSLLPLQ